jgi:hypothetical protein
MSSIATIVDTFIQENELEIELKPALQGLVNKCFEGVFKHIYSVPIPDTGSSSKTKAQKVLKADKIEDPTECQTRDELHHCTTASLAQFCKKNSLKVGGNKTDVIDRVWRFLQGTGSEEDKSPRNKAKATKKVAEKHLCSGCNAKGEKCAVAGTECFQETDYWFCWRHITEADEFITKLEDPNQPKPKERAPKPPKTEAAKAKAKASKGKASKGKELESESESETEPEPVKKSKATKGRGKAKAAKVESDTESEPESEPEPVKKSKAKASKVDTDAESDTSKGSKKKKKVIPVPDTDESEEDQDSEDERKEYYKKMAKQQFDRELAELEEEEEIDE